MKKKVVYIFVPILLFLVIVLVSLSVFVFSVREIEILDKVGEGGTYTFVRYIEDEQEYLNVKVITANELASKAVIYTSSQPEIAEVSEDGIITAKNPGEAVITVQAKYNPWVKENFPVTVIQKAVSMQIAMPEELPANEFYYLLHTGDAPVFVPKPEPVNGLVENLIYESSDPEIVTVTEDGRIQAHRTGIAEIQVNWTGPYTEEGKTENLGQFLVNVCRETDCDTLARHEMQWYEKSCFIAHALGNAGEYIYTNTKEALEESIKEGFQVLEVDLGLTSDGEVACRHTWYADVFDVSYDRTVPDLETFENEKYFGTLTPLTGRDLLEIWSEHPELYFVTDVKQDENTNLVETLEAFVKVAKEMGKEQLLEHLVVQIYDIEEYDKINAIYPIKNWVFTIYQLPETEEARRAAAEFAGEKDFGVFTVPASCMGDNYFVDLAKDNGMMLFIHTVDSAEAMWKCSKRGVYGYYTDFLAPNSIEK